MSSFGPATIAFWTEDVPQRSCTVAMFYAYRPAGGVFGRRRSASSPHVTSPGACGTVEDALSAGGEDALAAWESRGAIVGRLFSAG
jgi:hypothetical protein